MLSTRGRPVEAIKAVETDDEDQLAGDAQVPFELFYTEKTEIDEEDETVKSVGSVSPRTPVQSGRHGSSPRRTTYSSAAGEVSVSLCNVAISESDEVEHISPAGQTPFGQALFANPGENEAETENP